MSERNNKPRQGRLKVEGILTDANGNIIPVAPSSSSTSTTSSVANSASNQTLLASNTSRVGATITNTSPDILYVKLGATATTSDFTVRMVQYAYYEVPFGYTGRIDGIWAALSSGAALIDELT